ncbi:glycosyltransferase [Flavobacterium oreochromis]|uniref:glycosyltransferase family 2 protein n=1 Tax=Flavobacterium oreochromis TaxID=2906078 RepID=UPI003859EE62
MYIGDIEILVSTVNRKSLDFLYKMFPDFPKNEYKILIVNQYSSEDLKLNSDFKNIRIINSKTLGSSKNRNIALENAIGKIIVFADDDIVYPENFIKILVKAYSENNTEVIFFKANKNSTTSLKKYSTRKISNLGILKILSFGTIEITMNLEKIKQRGNFLLFDENFGINAIYKLGEEPIFLMDLKNKGCHFTFIPEILVYHEEDNSYDKLSINEKYFYFGAIYTRIFKYWFYLFIIIKIGYDLKDKKINVSNIYNLLNIALKGRKSFLSN